MFLQFGGPNPGLCTYRTSILLLNHKRSPGIFESGSPVFQDSLKHTIFLPLTLRCWDKRQESPCQMPADSAECPALRTSLRIWKNQDVIFFWCKCVFLTGKHTTYFPLEAFSKEQDHHLKLESYTVVVTQQDSGVVRNHKWLTEAMAVSINCPNSKSTRRNKITMLFVMAGYCQ